MEVILYQPEIPQNTGNIARTCVVTNTKLTLVRPLGFSLSKRHVKRSGLDYWDDLSLEVIDDLKLYLKQPFYFLSSKAKQPYTDIAFTPHTQLIFGSETKGLPPEYFETYPHLFFTIPMHPKGRCLNLSNSVAIVLYEGFRQLGFSF